MRNSNIKINKITYRLPLKKNNINETEKSPPVSATLQESLRFTIVIGQIFSLLPVHGLLNNKANCLRFTWTSWRSAYSLLSLLGQGLMTMMCIYEASNTKNALKDTTPIIFYLTTCITMVMFVRVAQQWPQLVQHIARTEHLDHNWDSGLTRRCNVTCAVVLIMSLFEYILSLQSAFVGGIQCRQHDTIYMGFVRHLYPWIFNYLPYSTLLGMLIQFLHIQSTFIWNFSNIFVICISYYLTSRLNNVNRKLLSARGKYMPESFWRRMRVDYSRSAQLVQEVDNVISGIVFVSFANNLFFICMQLFNTMGEGITSDINCKSRVKGTSYLGGYEAVLYYVFSLIYLIGRSVAVSLIMSQVNVASTAPASVLYGVPSPVYCIEVQRFLDQVNGETVALSGLQFFNVTRSLLLTVAGSIVTYELVMLQFNSPPQHTDELTPTSVTTVTADDTTYYYTTNLTLN